MTVRRALGRIRSATGRDPPLIGDTCAVDGPSLLTSWNVEPLQLAPLLSVRPGELRKAEWSEFNESPSTPFATRMATLRERIPEISTVRDATDHSDGHKPYYKKHEGKSAMA